MTDWTQLTARQLVDEIAIAISDKRPGDVKDITDVLTMREAELEELRRESTGLRAWNDRLREDNNKAWGEVFKLRNKVNGDQLQPWER
jgi:predicted nuclease with TOPRIM domain